MVDCRSLVLAILVAGLMASPVDAQYVVPSELSVGLGAVKDWLPSQWSPSVTGALTWDSDERWWATFVLEGEVGSLSDAEPCQRSPDDPPANCMDAVVLAGLRFRRAPHASSGWRPFATTLLGEYWKGSGTDDEEFASGHFALQVGGGLERRWAQSIQGLRVSLDYRHVFAGAPARNQVRVLALYVIGPRRFRPS